MADERGSAHDEHLASLIERLEVGMSALEELERGDALELVRRIADELRGQRAREDAKPRREDSEEVRTTRRPLRVMRTADELQRNIADLRGAIIDLLER